MSNIGTSPQHKQDFFFFGILSPNSATQIIFTYKLEKLNFRSWKKYKQFWLSI